MQAAGNKRWRSLLTNALRFQPMRQNRHRRKSAGGCGKSEVAQFWFPSFAALGFPKTFTEQGLHRLGQTKELDAHNKAAIAFFLLDAIHKLQPKRMSARKKTGSRSRTAEEAMERAPSRHNEIDAHIKVLEIPNETNTGCSPIGFACGSRSACRISQLAWRMSISSV